MGVCVWDLGAALPIEAVRVDLCFGFPFSLFFLYGLSRRYSKGLAYFTLLSDLTKVVVDHRPI